MPGRLRHAALLLLLAGLLVAGAAPTLATPLDTASTDAMAYCTPQHVKDAYSMEQVAEVTGDSEGQTVDDDALDQAVTDYGAYIETHVRMQHADNPFGNDHDFLRSLNIEGSFLLLNKRQPAGLTEEQADAEERLDDILLRIAEGELTLMNKADQADAEGRPDLDPEELVQSRRRVFYSSRWVRERHGLS